MRESELRLALVCYGGISLAVYMHGITKEVWRLACASRAELSRRATCQRFLNSHAFVCHSACLTTAVATV